MILKAQKLSKSYDNRTILKEVDLEIAPTQSLAICGASGSGKTTLLHILGTLDFPTTGTLTIQNTPVQKSTAHTLRRHTIGFIFQSYNLLEDFSALENVLMPSRIAREPISKEKALSLLTQVGLKHLANQPAKTLSGGERQRVAIARSLINNPSLILADEPTGNLDQKTAHEIITLLLSLNKALVLVTHDPALASLCQTQYLLQDGHLRPL